MIQLSNGALEFFKILHTRNRWIYWHVRRVAVDNKYCDPSESRANVWISDENQLKRRYFRSQITCLTPLKWISGVRGLPSWTPCYPLIPVILLPLATSQLQSHFEPNRHIVTFYHVSAPKIYSSPPIGGKRHHWSYPLVFVLECFTKL